MILSFHGYQCIVKQSWHSLYIYSILKQREPEDKEMALEEYEKVLEVMS